MRWLLVCLVMLGCDSRPGRGGTASPAGSVSVVAPGDAGVPLDDAAMDPDVLRVPEVSIVRPMDGARFVRDVIDGTAWVASVDVEVQGRDVVRLELRLDGAAIDAVAEASTTFNTELAEDGDHTLSVVGFDEAGLERARDEVAVVVLPPDDGSCHAMLDALGLDWSAAGGSPGIADPVRVEPFIGGVSYRFVSSESPTPMLMDCELATRLHRLSTLVQPHGIDEVIHIGVYNYRCIGGGDPDSGTCTPSQHAFARAIDIWGFGLAGSDDQYQLERDWVITEETCPGSPADEADRVLHEIGCAMWSERIFQTILTPNYNADHRNHFHVDMTADRMFIGVSVAGVDPDVPGLGHQCSSSVFHHFHHDAVRTSRPDLTGDAHAPNLWFLR